MAGRNSWTGPGYVHYNYGFRVTVAVSEFLLGNIDKLFRRIGNRLIPQGVYDKVATQWLVCNGRNLTIFLSTMSSLNVLM